MVHGGEVGLKSRLIGGSASQSQHTAGCLNRTVQQPTQCDVLKSHSPIPYTATRYVHGIKLFGLMSLPVQLLNDFRSDFGLDRLCSRPRQEALLLQRNRATRYVS